jgi:cytidine deaminase
MSMPAKMRLLPEYIEAIREGRKTTTIRIGKRGVATSELTFESNADSINVQVLSVYYRKFSELTEMDAQKDGFNTLHELETALNAFYPNIKPNTTFTVVEFKA